MPDEARVRSVLAEAATAQVTPWTTEGSRASLLASAPVPGHVTATRTIASIGVTVLTLSNGVEVWLKPTDFKNDQVLMSAYARGRHVHRAGGHLSRRRAVGVAGEHGRTGRDDAH